MPNTTFVEERVSRLRKMIATLEWDTPHIKNHGLRAIKVSELGRYRQELQTLLTAYKER